MKLCYCEQAQLVGVLVARRNLKEACRIVKAHRLHEEFPTIEEQYQEDTLERLMNKQLWPAAINVVKDNKALQVSPVYPRFQGGAL